MTTFRRSRMSLSSRKKISYAGCSFTRSLQFLNNRVHIWPRPRLSLYTSPRKVFIVTVNNPLYLSLTNPRVWLFSDAHFTEEDTKTIHINLIRKKIVSSKSFASIIWTHFLHPKFAQGFDNILKMIHIFSIYSPLSGILRIHNLSYLPQSGLVGCLE